MEAERNRWLDGVMGVVIGDALGCPVQFESREQVAGHPVTGMRGYGTFDLPEGSWTDDSSMTIALLESIRRNKSIDLDDIMKNYMNWLEKGDFTPYGRSFDVGMTTRQAIFRYKKNKKVRKSGLDDERSNGNGSLMRILPVCIYCTEKILEGKLTATEAIKTVHGVGGLTHSHILCNIACGLYFFMSLEIITGSGCLQDRLQKGLDSGFDFYEDYLADKEYLHYYDRMKDLSQFGLLPEEKIRSGGYVVDSLEASLWCLINTDCFRDALLKAVNLGKDTDTTSAIAGGLAGLFYGYSAIPEEWLSVIVKREWIEDMCDISL